MMNSARREMAADITLFTPGVGSSAGDTQKLHGIANESGGAPRKVHPLFP